MSVRLPAIFNDNAVLQQGIEIPVWGWAEAGETVSVSCADQEASGIAGADGKWMVRLGAIGAGGPYEMTVKSGDCEIVLQNVAVGEVWVASGQSNMEWPLVDARNGKEERAAADYPMIREFGVPRIHTAEPQDDCDGEWLVASPGTAGKFSAVGYFFARYLQEQLGVPVGIIHTSWGGSKAICWCREQELAKEKEFGKWLDGARAAILRYPDEAPEWERQLAAYNIGVAEAQKNGGEMPRVPVAPEGAPTLVALGLYNAMIHPIVPYAIKGAIWYQGESDSFDDRYPYYERMMEVLIEGWRDDWGQGDFPFLFVQLANFVHNGNWAWIREAQLNNLSIANTAMASAVDIGEKDDIHPKNKQDVGLRLGLAARVLAYGEDIVYSGPIYSGMTAESGKLRLSFEHVGSGLRGADGSELEGFLIAGADGQFGPAHAEIEGDTVVVWHEMVPEPAAVRYAWADNPVCSLFNEEGLPASPFRTDDWQK